MFNKDLKERFKTLERNFELLTEDYTRTKNDLRQLANAVGYNFVDHTLIKL